MVITMAVTTTAISASTTMRAGAGPPRNYPAPATPLRVSLAPIRRVRQRGSAGSSLAPTFVGGLAGDAGGAADVCPGAAITPGTLDGIGQLCLCLAHFAGGSGNVGQRLQRQVASPFPVDGLFDRARGFTPDIRDRVEDAVPGQVVQVGVGDTLL